MNQQTLPLHTAAHAATEARLLDKVRELQAQLYGARIELAMHAGLRDDAQYWKEAMEKVVNDRRDAALGAAEARSGCFFVAAGRMDAAELRQEPAHG
jgi:hypothetical protein